MKPTGLVFKKIAGNLGLLQPYKFTILFSFAENLLRDKSHEENEHGQERERSWADQPRIPTVHWENQAKPAEKETDVSFSTVFLLTYVR